MKAAPDEKAHASSVAEQEFTFGPFTLDVGARTLRRNGESVTLPPKSFDTLLALVRNRARVVTKDELIRAVWPDSFVSDDSLTQSIWLLRRALGDDTSQPHFIATVPRRGYRFIAPIEELPGATDTAVRDGPGTGPDAPRVPATTSDDAQRRWYQAAPFAVWATIVMAGLAAVAAVLAVGSRANTASPLGPLRVSIAAPPGTRLVSGGAVSPDSRYVALVARQEQTGRASLWIRSLESGETRAVEGTEGAARPFWSPDGESLGFFAGGNLKTVGLEGDAARTLAAVGLNPAGASWGSSGLILFAGSRSGLSTIPIAGGRATPATVLDPTQLDQAHRWPEFLPDGRHFLFTVVSSNRERAGTYVGSLDSPEIVRLSDTPNAFATYAPSGYILSVRDGALVAQAFDWRSRRLLDQPFVVTSNVTAPDFLNSAMISASGGVLALGRGGVGGRLVWFDRSGRRIGAIDAPGPLHNPTLAPNQQLLLADTAGETNAELRGVWQIDLERGTRTRVVTAGGTPIWAPDGERIAFTSNRTGGVGDLYVRSTSGHTDGDVLLHTAENKGLNDWTRDGRYIVYLTTNAATKKDLWLLPMFGDRRPVPLLQTPFEELQAQVSPDGRWVAYVSNESGRWEVYVQSFPQPGTKFVVSTGGGGQPQWRADGAELFYLASDHVLMALDVVPGPSWRAGRPRPLFRAPVTGDTTTYRTRYAVAANGQRVLIDSAEEGSQELLTLIVNWVALAQR